MPLPSIALNSVEGKQLFQEAMTSTVKGGLGCYFPLSEQFITQSEPAFCSLSSLAMVLNALSYDPKRIWKGPWRWFTEELLQCDSSDCCGNIEKVKNQGLDFDQFLSVIKCQGVYVTSQRVFNTGTTGSGTGPEPENGTGIDNNTDDYEQFKSILSNICSNDNNSDRFMIVNYCRSVLGQTGTGHYRYTYTSVLYIVFLRLFYLILYCCYMLYYVSPIGGYHAASESVLILDVVRIAYFVA